MFRYQTFTGKILMEIVLVLIVLGLYFTPTFVASSRDHPNTGAILALNILLGWTLLGWVAALVWAMTGPAASPANAVPPLPDAGAQRMKTRPKCAEDVRQAATLYRFCGYVFS